MWMYEWRKMSDVKRSEVLTLRRQCRRPWHSPPHFENEGHSRFHLSAANYEHRTVIGKTQERMTWFENELCTRLKEAGSELFAWFILPNHWHALLSTDNLSTVLKAIGKLHGRSSFAWNDEDDARGRKCWHGCTDRRIRSDEHFFAVRNYIHHNPVKHGYTARWEDWAFSSADEFLKEVGREEAMRQWRDYPVLEMGKKWDFD
jgi:putative transposase